MEKILLGEDFFKKKKLIVYAGDSHYQIFIESGEQVEFLPENSGDKPGCKRPFLVTQALFHFPTFTPGCRGQRWTVQTCLTCQRSQRFLNDPAHVLWGDLPEAQLGSQSGKNWTKMWDIPRE